MATTSSRTIEITVVSGEDLRINRKPIKKKTTFATVKFDRQSIGRGGSVIDEPGGGNPIWNEKIAMEMPIDAMFLTIEVHCGSVSRSRIVGTAIVPVSDFLGRYRPESYLHLLSYRLKDGNGDRNGIVNIMVRIRASESNIGSKAIVEVPASLGRNRGVAIGVPLWCSDYYKS